MEKYIEPVVEIIIFDNEDIITTSNNEFALHNDNEFALPDIVFVK